MNPYFRRFTPSFSIAVLTFFHSLTFADTAAPSAANTAPLPLAEAKHEPHLTSTIFEWDKLPVQKTATGERREVVDGATPTLAQFRCHVTTLNPGSPWGSLDKHTDEEVVIVKEGVLEYEINGRIQTAGPGAIILLVAGETHRSRNGSDTPVTYYVFHAVTAEAKAAAERTPKLASTQ